MSQEVTLTTHPRFVLIEPKPTPARVGDSFQVVDPQLGRVESLLHSASSSQYIAIDLETRGTDYSLPEGESDVVGVGLAWDGGSMYLPLEKLNLPHIGNLFIELILSHKGLLAHNVYFDGGFLRRDLGQHPSWYACTYGMYMQLASEGWTGQKWSLKDAMVDVLMWNDTNEKDLDEWLVNAGYKKQNNAPLKGEMWRAPPSILGKYCVLDVEATYLLFTEHFLPLLQRFPAVLSYHQKDFLPHVMIHIDQKMVGIATDREHWSEYLIQLEKDIDTYTNMFLTDEKVASHIDAMVGEKVAEFLHTEPPRYNKVKERKEPAKFTKAGQLSKNWVRWSELEEVGPKESARWQAWMGKKEKILSGQVPDYMFNIQSGKQMAELLYDKMGLPVPLLTDKGLPSTSEDALLMLGDVVKPLLKRTTASKEMSFVKDYLSRTEERNTIHPSFKLPGTVTGRLSGKEPNVQQCPKVVGILGGFIARPGYVFVDCDVNALEMVVTAELSQDKNLLALYGPGAKPNDIYSFYGSMMANIGPKIKATGYDPYNPTTETIARIKKECKAERSIAKLLILSDNYGSGIGKKQQILNLNGVDVTFDEVKNMHQSLQDAKSGVLTYINWLRSMWKKNKGWIENAYGRPICVDESREKDLLNRCVQSSGHDILQLYSRLSQQLLNDNGVEWRPIIMDWHDELIVETKEEDGQRVFDLLEKDAFDILNKELGGTCPLKGGAAIGRSLADIKIEG